MRILASLFLLLLLVACGTATKTTINVAGSDKDQNDKYIIDLQDQRPSSERRSTQLKESGATTTTLGDDAVTPSAPALLRAALQNSTDPTVDGHRYVLTVFKVTVFEPPVSAPPGVEAAGVLALIGGHMIASARSYKQVTVMIEGTVDGREFRGFASDGFQGRVQAEEIAKVISRALDSSITYIGQVLKEPAQTAGN